MTFIKNPFTERFRILRAAVAAALLAAAVGSPALAEEPVTHHFSIVRPASPVIVGTPVEIEITARLENNKLNKKAAHALLIQTTSVQGGQAQVASLEADMKRGAARVTVTFDNLGPAILQVTDRDNAALTNSASFSVLPQPRKRGVRP